MVSLCEAAEGGVKTNGYKPVEGKCQLNIGMTFKLSPLLGGIVRLRSSKFIFTPVKASATAWHGMLTLKLKLHGRG